MTWGLIFLLQEGIKKTWGGGGGGRGPFLYGPATLSHAQNPIIQIYLGTFSISFTAICKMWYKLFMNFATLNLQNYPLFFIWYPCELGLLRRATQNYQKHATRIGPNFTINIGRFIACVVYKFKIKMLNFFVKWEITFKKLSPTLFVLP